jgi:hypothetical protein
MSSHHIVKDNQEPAAKNGIVHIHHEQGDLLMMECMD